MAPILRVSVLALLVLLAYLQTSSGQTSTSTTTGGNSTTTGTTGTTGATTGGNTSSTNGSVCVPTDDTTTAEVCPQLIGVMRPSNMEDVNVLFESYKQTLCEQCKSKAAEKYLCAAIKIAYLPCSADQTQQGNPCRTDCEAVNFDCEDHNVTSPLADCRIFSQDTATCIENTKDDMCSSPPFLLRKTAGAPNWVWIFIVGLGGLVVILVVAAIILFLLQRDKFQEVINPCKWCECCPGYYDL